MFGDVAHTGKSRTLSEREMYAWGVAFGRELPPGSVVALEGELGAGKTTLARALCEGLGVVDIDSVTSPTFSLVQEYAAATGHVLHADLYRLRTPEELFALGWDELVQGARATIVEWPKWLHRVDVRIQLAHDETNAGVRRVTVVE